MFLRLRRLIRSAGREVVVLWYACRNPATPVMVKLLALFMAFYIISPIDLIPEALPLLGLVDDVTLLALGIPALLKLVPALALDDARSASERLVSRWKFWRVRP